MFNRFILLLIALGFVWFILEEKEMPTNQSDLSLVVPKSLSRGPSSVKDEKNCSGPCLSLTTESAGQTILIDADDDVVHVDLIRGDRLQMKLINSKAYDVIQTYGSNEADFANQTLVINWTLSDISEYTISQSQNKFRYYRTQWRLIGEPKFKTAVFVIDTLDIKSPELILHHQPLNSGIQKLTFLSLEKNGTAVDENTAAPLVLARNSLLGYEIYDPAKSLNACVYQAPNGSEENCASWAKSKLIRSISEQDVGVHKIQVFTEREQFNFEFRVLGIQ